ASSAGDASRRPDHDRVTSSYEVGHRDVDYGFGTVGVGFVVAGQSAVVHGPADGPLDGPARGKWLKIATAELEDYG
ncbi:hypothetical protein AB0H18_43995, partial [Streptomyces sp. NPDC020766]|uniref:hypothetical protein n=1 Tax=Streptomyces sp. NPDC020766 TaxID=3155011 RepID=UPI0033E05FD1